MALDPFRYLDRAAPVIVELAHHIYGTTRLGVASSTWCGRGYSPDSTEHATRRALDWITVPTVGRLPDDPAARRRSFLAGDLIAAWLIAHADQLHIRHILWNKRIWRRRRRHEGWQPLPGRGAGSSVSDWHQDHLHIYLDDATGTVPAAPVVTTLTTTPTLDKETVMDANDLATAILNHPIEANGRIEPLATHLGRLFVDTAAQSVAVTAERTRDRAGLDLILDHLEKIDRRLTDDEAPAGDEAGQ